MDMLYTFFTLLFVCTIFITIFWTLYSLNQISNKVALVGSGIFGAIAIFAVVMVFVTFYNKLPPTNLNTCEQMQNYFKEEGSLPLHYLDQYIFECIEKGLN